MLLVVPESDPEPDSDPVSEPTETTPDLQLQECKNSAWYKDKLMIIIIIKNTVRKLCSKKIHKKLPKH